MATGKNQRTIILFIVALAVGGVFWLRETGARSSGNSPSATRTLASLPRFLDLSADKCVPCKMMVPVLAQLEAELPDQLEVGFLDVWKNPDAAKPYQIKLIPTQIFFDPDGKELFRHEGFFSKDDILAKWNELGYEFHPAPPKRAS